MAINYPLFLFTIINGTIYISLRMKSHLDHQFLENATETLRAVAHPIRITIIDLLARNEQLTVTEIYEQLDIEQAVASHHLRILKNRRVLSVERSGKNSLYSLANKEYSSIVNSLSKII